jgi:resuscitation-promoting factor RpfB
VLGVHTRNFCRMGPRWALANSKRTLKSAGVRRRQADKANRLGERRGSVISQSPAAGTSARLGREVSLLTAKPAPEPESNCTAGHSCLPPASDYDCARGSGDGPKYVYGTVQVTGSDPYGLDPDNDGVGC